MKRFLTNGRAICSKGSRLPANRSSTSNTPASRTRLPAHPISSIFSASQNFSPSICNLRQADRYIQLIGGWYGSIGRQGRQGAFSIDTTALTNAIATATATNQPLVLLPGIHFTKPGYNLKILIGPNGL